MSDYTPWLGPQKGIAPEKGASSFNNILYSYELYLGKMLNGTLSSNDTQILLSHLLQTNDKNGLYAPKNSHDNLTAKYLASYEMGFKFHKEMKLSEMIKRKHPRDIILYIFWRGNKVQRFLARLFLWFPALAMIWSCYNKGKVRPVFYDSWRDFKFQVIGKLLRWKTSAEPRFAGTHYIRYKGADAYDFIQIQNDGKILAPLRLFTLKEQSFTMRVTAKICQRILRKRYGSNYMSALFNNYFPEPDHPVRVEWEKVTQDILD